MEMFSNWVILSFVLGIVGAAINATTYEQSHLNVQGQYFLKQNGAFPTNEAEFLTFRVKGIRGARLLLYSTETTSVTRTIYYYIRIGNEGNTKSFIQHITKHIVTGYEQIVSENEGAQLDAYSFKSFWISWGDGKIKVGRGDVFDQNMFMSYTDPCPFEVMDIGITGGAFLQWPFPKPTNSSVATTTGLQDCSRCLTYSRRLQCPLFAPMQSFQSSSVECNTACSVNENCWGWKHTKETGSCDLMSGEVTQSYGTSSIFLKKK